MVMEPWFDDEKGCKFSKSIVVAETEGVTGSVVMVVDMAMERDAVEEEDCGVGSVMSGGYDWRQRKEREGGRFRVGGSRKLAERSPQNPFTPPPKFPIIRKLGFNFFYFPLWIHPAEIEIEDVARIKVFLFGGPIEPARAGLSLSPCPSFTLPSLQVEHLKPGKLFC